jgi:hypothetical protein
MKNTAMPLCLHCGVEMELNRRLPHLGDRPAMEIFECNECGEFLTRLQRTQPHVFDWNQLPAIRP